MANRPPINDLNNNPGLIGIGPQPSAAPKAAFNVDGVNDLINNRGFKAVHYRHAYNPDREFINSPSQPDTQGSYRGLIYYRPQWVRHVPRSFSMDNVLTAQAVYGQGSVLMNVSGHYIDSDEKVHVRPRDLIVFPTLTDMTQQNFEYNPTGSQKLHFKVKGVDQLFDSRRTYENDRDFKVTDDGLIEWLDGGLRPEQNTVLSVVYYYTPIFIVTNLMHNLRVLHANSQGHGGLPTKAVYGPQQFVCKPSVLVEEENLLSWEDMPPLPEYPASDNTTGGSV